MKDEKFDLILFNPPFYKGKPKNLHNFSWRTGENFETFTSFSENFEYFSEKDGKALIVLLSNSVLPENY